MQSGPKFNVVFSVFQFILPVESLYPEEVSKLRETVPSFTLVCT